MKKELDFTEMLTNEGFAPFEINELTKDDLLAIENNEVFEYLFSIDDEIARMKIQNKLMERAKELKITRSFSQTLKTFKDNLSKVVSNNDKTIKEIEGIPENLNFGGYIIGKEGEIYEMQKESLSLVCYHPIIPVEKLINVENGSEKIKLIYFKNNEKKEIIVDKSVIASTQTIIRLSDIGISVTSENAKALIKYLSEMEYLNKDKIKIKKSISRLGWYNNKLFPYSNEIEFDNKENFYNYKEAFGKMGTLEEWVDFFKERRKFNVISRILMASSVASILLNKIKLSGFNIHVYGESENGKTVACMAAQSIFGNPSQNEKNGIGINFNFTKVGLEFRLNLYNNLPMFINEMQLQREIKNYDNILFTIEAGKGKARGNKNGGLGMETSWDLISITNGEKNIITSSSDNGAYNRCLACELNNYSFENLSEVAEFSKEHYGTAIREILKHLDEYDIKNIYKESLEKTKEQGNSITDKQKIMEAVIITGDKILTDIVFKDNYYLNINDFKSIVAERKELEIERRAYYYVKDWYTQKSRCFLNDDNENEDLKYTDILGRIIEINGRKHIAFLKEPLKSKIEENYPSFDQISKLWAEKGYSKCEKGRTAKSVRINGVVQRCIVLDIDMFNDEEDLENYEISEEMPF